MRSIRRPSPALVVASVALFAAVGGTSYAAAKIHGSDIAKKTITGYNVADKTLSGKKMKKNTLGGDQVKESKLGPVPEATHAGAADTATTAGAADTATTAGDAGTLDGVDSTGFMRSVQRLYEIDNVNVNNFADNQTLAALPNLPAGTYLVSARLTYDSDGGASVPTCTLHVPGSNDNLQVEAADGATVVLQEGVTSAATFGSTVSCTGDGDDDAFGVMINALRVD